MNVQRLRTLAAIGDTEAQRELLRLTWRRSNIAATQTLLDQLGAVEARSWAAHALDWRSVRVRQDWRGRTTVPARSLVDLVTYVRPDAALVLVSPVRVPLLWSEAIALAVASDLAERAIDHAERVLQMRRAPAPRSAIEAVTAARTAIAEVRRGIAPAATRCDRLAAALAAVPAAEWAAYAGTVAGGTVAYAAALAAANAAANAVAGDVAYAAAYAGDAAAAAAWHHAAPSGRAEAWRQACEVEREPQAARLWMYLTGEVAP